jgi:hypothetical protein
VSQLRTHKKFKALKKTIKKPAAIMAAIGFAVAGFVALFRNIDFKMPFVKEG